MTRLPARFRIEKLADSSSAHRHLRGKIMRRYLMGMLLLVAFGGTGIAYADDGFCNGGGLDPDPEWNGGACPMVRSTLPGADGVLPNFANLDLKYFYPTGSLQPFSFFHFANELNLVGTAQGAKLDVVELTLRSDDPRSGDYMRHVLGMSVRRDSRWRGRTLLFTLRSDFVSLTGDRHRPSPALVTASAELTPSIESVHVSFEPEDGDWARVRLVVRNAYNWQELPVAFDVGASFLLQPAARYADVRPWHVSAGVIRGDLQSVGMTAAFEFDLPRIEH